MTADHVPVRSIDQEADVLACYPLMRQLRPHLTSAAEFVDRWRRQTATGYRLLALWPSDCPVALAGFRIQENLVHGRHLYVDDLVTNASLRGSGHGGALMHWLMAEGKAHGCDKLLLDTPLFNSLGHRFYFRNGLLATALRFSISLD